MEIRTWQGDITTLAVDAIVNAANEGLRPGGGVCGAIFAAAGPELVPACAALGHCPTGEAVTTPGFALPARWVIHTVGPVWRGGDRGEEAALASCYRAVVAEAGHIGARSVGIPAISTGIFGFPADRAARIAVDTLRELAASPAGADLDDVVLVAFDGETARRYEQELARA